MTRKSILSEVLFWYPAAFWLIQIVIGFVSGNFEFSIWTLVAGLFLTLGFGYTLAWKLASIHKAVITRERIAHEAEMYALATAHGWTVADRKDDGTGKVTVTLLYGEALKREHERREADRGGE